jgi:hypothetical protein
MAAASKVAGIHDEGVPMYEDMESTVTFTGGTLAMTGVMFSVEWLVAIAVTAILVGVGALRLANR